MNKIKSLAPVDELDVLIREATQTIEDELNLEDAGWISLSGTSGDVIASSERIANLKLSRLYSAKDPLGRQAIRLWTDYTFGRGMTWQAEDKATQDLLGGVWNDPYNQCTLSASGQRRSSDKLLIDGEIFFAIFLGASGDARIRRIDPLEITEIITDPDDIDDVKYYKRVWMNQQNEEQSEVYRSTMNIKGEPCTDSAGADVQTNEGPLIHHLPFAPLVQRGNPLLLPALPWIKYYRKFLIGRVAITAAHSRFAWHTKAKGGAAKVDALKVKTHEKEIPAGSHLLESLGSDTSPIKTDSGARNAYEDGRMLKLQVCAAVGIPEQYFGDISIGNLATAKTVELPMQKMFESYQQVWSDTYKDIDELILGQAKIAPQKWYVDRDFPPIAPLDVALVAEAIVGIVGVMPEFAYSPDVQQIALLALGINDPQAVIEALTNSKESNVDVRLVKVLRQFQETLKQGVV